MEFENRFLVKAPIEDVWALLLDVGRIAPCMPGAQVLEQTGDDAYKVAVKVRLGPMTMNYKGDVEVLEQDAASHRATMSAKAKEARGQGTAQATIRMELQESGGGTAASITTNMSMSGKAAAMGQGVIKDVAASLTDTFAKNLAGMIDRGEPQAAAPEAPRPPGAAAPPEAEAGVAAEPAAPPEPEPAADAALPAGQLVRSVIAGRLRDPRTAGALAFLMLLVGYALGRRRGS